MLGLSLAGFAALHTVLGLIGVFSGLIMVGGMLCAGRLPVTTAIFLFTTGLTTITAFMFPIDGFTPGLGAGMVSVVALVAAIAAMYVFHLAGIWRRVYVIGAIAALYLNVFVTVVQTFHKVALLRPLVTEPPFMITQLVVLMVFVWLGVLALRRFHV